MMKNSHIKIMQYLTALKKRYEGCIFRNPDVESIYQATRLPGGKPATYKALNEMVKLGYLKRSGDKKLGFWYWLK